MKRIIFDILFIISVFILPWWFNVILAFIGVFLFDKFYEFILILLIIYSLYSISEASEISHVIIVAMIINAIYFLVQVFKSNISFYQDNSIKFK